MLKFSFFLIICYFKVTASQIIVPINQPIRYTNLQQPAISNYVQTTPDYEYYTQLANTVESIVLNRLIKNTLTKPAFKKISGPLIQEVILKTQGRPILNLPYLAQNIVTQPGTRSIIAQPAMQSIIAQPAVQKIITQPVAQNVLPQSAVLNIIAQLLAPSIIAQPAAQNIIPLAQNIITQPAAQNVISQPTVQNIIPLAQPSAQNIIFQPRTQSIVAQPAPQNIIAQPAVSIKQAIPNAAILQKTVTQPGQLYYAANGQMNQAISNQQPSTLVVENAQNGYAQSGQNAYQIPRIYTEQIANPGNQYVSAQYTGPILQPKNTANSAFPVRNQLKNPDFTGPIPLSVYQNANSLAQSLPQQVFYQNSNANPGGLYANSIYS